MSGYPGGPPGGRPSGVNSRYTPSTAEMEQMFWSHQGDPASYIFYQVIGCTATAMLCTSIWSSTVRYYEWFGRSDVLWVKLAVGAGTTIATGSLIMDMAQLRLISDHIFVDYFKIQQRDGIINLVKAFISNLCAFFACLYYSYKVYTLWGKRWYILVVGVLITLSHGAWCFYVTIWMFRLPEFSLENIQLLQDFNNFSAPNMRIFVWVNLSHDLVLCAILFALLHHTKVRLFHLGKNLLPKLSIIIFECMLPPMVCSALILAGSISSGNDSHGWVTIFYSPIGPLYFHSVLLSLVSRKKLRDLLDDNLASNGVVKLGNSSSGGTYNNNPLDSVSIQVEQHSMWHKIPKDRPRLNRDLATDEESSQKGDKEDEEHGHHSLDAKRRSRRFEA